MSRAVNTAESYDDQDEPRDPAEAREVAGWVTLLLRSVKTCRLYDAANPNVTRFRRELAEATDRLLDRCGMLRLDVTSSSFVWNGETVFQAHSRDDNLAAVFHRDGVRALTLMSGIAYEEVQGLLDAVLRVTGPAPVDDDLVTMLWEANLPHLQVSAVPLEGDVDGGEELAESEEGPRVPWPGDLRVSVAPGPPSDGVTPLSTRSDDWASVDGAADPETVFEELESGSVEHLDRFQRERREAQEAPLVTAVAAVLADAFEAGATPEDRAELAAFAPRLLREAIAQGEWSAAGEALRLWRSGVQGDPVSGFLEGLRDPGSPVTAHALAALDRQGEDGLQAFLDFAAALGKPAAPWLMTVLAESQRRRVRQPLARIIADLVRDDPAVLEPWIADPRWYVVRNVVHIFSLVGVRGKAAADLVRAVLRHPEPRVRREAVDVLGQAAPEAARPLLIAMLEGAEPRLYSTILQRLSADPHPDVTACVLAAFESETFDDRSDEESRAILKALSTRGDAVLPALEQALNRGGLFAKGDEGRRQAVAFCIARMGTAAARAALERGTRSLKPAVRKACEQALSARGRADA